MTTLGGKKTPDGDCLKVFMLCNLMLMQPTSFCLSSSDWVSVCKLRYFAVTYFVLNFTKINGLVENVKLRNNQLGEMDSNNRRGRDGQYHGRCGRDGQ